MIFTNNFSTFRNNNSINLHNKEEKKIHSVECVEKTYKGEEEGIHKDLNSLRLRTKKLNELRLEFFKYRKELQISSDEFLSKYKSNIELGEMSTYLD